MKCSGGVNSSSKPGLKLMLNHNKTEQWARCTPDFFNKPSDGFGMGFGWATAVVLVVQTRENQQLELQSLPIFYPQSDVHFNTSRFPRIWPEPQKPCILQDSIASWLARLKMLQKSSVKYWKPRAIVSSWIENHFWKSRYFMKRKRQFSTWLCTIWLSAILVDLASFFWQNLPSPIWPVYVRAYSMR